MNNYENEISRLAIPLKGDECVESLALAIKDKKIVMLGEASHGTEEFYKWRQLISQELISKHGFSVISVEGDWPDCQKINRFIKGNENLGARSVLSTFDRWPTWMWANVETLSFINWLKAWNQDQSRNVSFYGLDVYSFYESMNQVVATLKNIDPELATFVAQKYSCFSPYLNDEKQYMKSLFRTPEGCKREVIDVLNATLQRRLSSHSHSEEWFDVYQNSKIVADAERYYRAVIFNEEDSWNVREEHMMSTLQMLLDKHGSNEKIIVWAHNTHVGDYRATDMIVSNHLNIGGLARKIYGAENVALVGFGSYEGSVNASYMWNGPTLKYDVPEARPGSIEHACHHVVSNVGHENFYFMIDSNYHGAISDSIVGHRAIGVVYDPDLEHRGNYVPTSLGKRYDAFIYFDRTNALTPLKAHTDKRKLPETYPFGNRM